MTCQPKHASADCRIDAGLFPAGDFIAASVLFMMVSSTQRNSELIANLAAERPGLRESQVVSI
jgi:hypothetical protein